MNGNMGPRVGLFQLFREKKEYWDLNPCAMHMYAFHFRCNFIYHSNLSCGIFAVVDDSPVEVSGWVVDGTLLSLSTNNETTDQSQVMHWTECFWTALFLSPDSWSFEKTTSQGSRNQINCDSFARGLSSFALGTQVYSLRLFDSLDCLCNMWLLRDITLVLILLS